MKPFYDLNRLICRCLEVLNIFIALPFGAFVYVVSVDYLTRSTASIDHDLMVYNSDVTVNVVSVILALVAVLYVNGGIAQALDKRRFLEHISQSVEDIDTQAARTDSQAVITLHDAQAEPVKKSGVKKPAKKKTAKEAGASKPNKVSPAPKKRAAAKAKTKR